MQVMNIQIKKLFGLFDHDIKLRIRDRITIIHGPNGVGKTTILQLLKDILEKKIFAVLQVPFSQIIIKFTNGIQLTFIKHDKRKLSFNIKEGRNIIVKDTISSESIVKHIGRGIPLGAIDEYLPFLDRVGPRTWLDLRDNSKISLEEVFDLYKDSLPIRRRVKSPIPAELKDLLNTINTYFIQTQRLLILGQDDVRYTHPRKRVKAKNTVEQYALEMAQMLKEKLSLSGSKAAELDRTFPDRILRKKTTPKTATEGWIRSKYMNQSLYRERLMKAGLIDEEKQVSLPNRNLSNHDLKVLWYYLSDIDKKLKVFDPLLLKIELFNDIINSRFLFKTFTINKIDGFRFNLESGEKIPLRQLSSGEQHELVLAFELLFKVPEKSFIMIDEPELSLHVTWQHKFLTDLERISELVDLDFLVATHSPSIIHDRRNLMVNLGGSSHA